MWVGYPRSAAWCGLVRLRIPLLILGAWLVAWVATNSGVAQAQDVQWSVQPLRGTVSIRDGDGPWRKLTGPTKAGPGTEIETGADGGATVARLGDTITVAPNSRIAVPVRKAGEPAPNIVQRLGVALYRMLTRVGGNQFEVQTPYLAAVIKGTVFAVSVTPDGGALHVTEGLVQVSSRATGQRALISPGQTARVSSRPGAGLDVHTPGKGRSSPSTDNASDNAPGDGGDAGASNGQRGNSANTPARDNSGATGRGQGSGQGQGKGKSAGKSKLRIAATIDAGVGDIAKSTRGFLKRIDAGGGVASSANSGRGNANGRPGGNFKSSPGAKVKTAIPGLASLTGTQPGGVNSVAGLRGFNSNGKSNAARSSSARGNSASNAGGNGNGNAGGNGNGNAGGNGKGKGKKK